MDDDLARRIGADLRAAGIDVWLDEWTLKPGDSLRQKIEGGIEGCEFFFVLLTPDSLRSSWVQEEIDAGFIRRVQGDCRFVPIVHGVEDSHIPLLLRTVVYVTLEPYEQQIRHLINSCFNESTAPPIGAPPAWAGDSSHFGLSPVANALALHICKASIHGMSHDPMLDPTEAMAVLSLAVDDFEDAVVELEGLGLIRVARSMSGVRGIKRVSPEPQLFFDLDGQLYGWNAEGDARKLAALLVNHQSALNAEQAARELNWTPRRMNPACAWLERYGLIQNCRVMGTSPWERLYLMVTPKARRFARNGKL